MFACVPCSHKIAMMMEIRTDTDIFQKILQKLFKTTSYTSLERNEA